MMDIMMILKRMDISQNEQKQKEEKTTQNTGNKEVKEIKEQEEKEDADKEIEIVSDNKNKEQTKSESK